MCACLKITCGDTLMNTWSPAVLIRHVGISCYSNMNADKRMESPIPILPLSRQRNSSKWRMKRWAANAWLCETPHTLNNASQQVLHNTDVAWRPECVLLCKLGVFLLSFLSLRSVMIWFFLCSWGRCSRCFRRCTSRTCDSTATAVIKTHLQQWDEDISVHTTLTTLPTNKQEMIVQRVFFLMQSLAKWVLLRNTVTWTTEERTTPMFRQEQLKQMTASFWGEHQVKS